MKSSVNSHPAGSSITGVATVASGITRVSWIAAAQITTHTIKMAVA